MLVKTDCIPLTKVLKVLVVVERVFELTAVVVDTCPLTVEVITLPVEDIAFVVEATEANILVVATFPFTVEVNSPELVAYDTVLVVLLATKLVRSVVVATPFTVDVSTDPAVDS
jgi:hypothetical protein